MVRHDIFENSLKRFLAGIRSPKGLSVFLFLSLLPYFISLYFSLSPSFSLLVPFPVQNLGFSQAQSMAKTHAGHVFSTGRISARGDKEATEDSLRVARRNNRLLKRALVDLRASSKCMKYKSVFSKGQSSATVSITDSPSPPIPKVHGIPLTFRSPKFSTRFQNLMVNKHIDLLLFHQIGVTALFENVGLVVILSPCKSSYTVLIKQFFENIPIKSDWIHTFIQNKTLSIDTILLGSLFEILYSDFCPFTLCHFTLKFENFTVLDQLKIVKDCSTTELVALPKVVETTLLNSVIHKLIRANLVP